MQKCLYFLELLQFVLHLQILYPDKEQMNKSGTISKFMPCKLASIINPTSWHYKICPNSFTHTVFLSSCHHPSAQTRIVFLSLTTLIDIPNICRLILIFHEKFLYISNIGRGIDNTSSYWTTRNKEIMVDRAGKQTGPCNCIQSDMALAEGL